MSEQVKLGQLCSLQEKRDAIHVAVTPVLAVERLLPGQRVVFARSGSTQYVKACRDTEPVGIIDPFLDTAVQENQCCWLCLFPGTVTSLKHNWRHPLFPEEQTGIQASKEEAWRTQDVLSLCWEVRGDQYTANTLLVLADALEETGCNDEHWLLALRRGSMVAVQRIVCLLLGGELAESVHWVEEFAQDLDYTYNRLMTAAENLVGSGDKTLDEIEGYKNPTSKTWDQFWRHYEVIMQDTLNDYYAVPFSCSC